MPIQDAYPNLPGLVAQINDGGLKLPQPVQALTQTVLLLGTATDGPSNTPINIASVSGGESLFGVAAAPTTYAQTLATLKMLTCRVYELFQAGCSDIRLCRVGGTSASLVLVDSTTVANDITLTANYPGVKYDGLLASVIEPATGVPGSINITTLDGVVHSFPFTAATAYADLLAEINNSNINVSAQQGPTGSQTALVTLTAVASAPFSGGVDGTAVTDAQYSDALSTAYQQLENYPVNVVVPCGAYLQPTMALSSMGVPNIPNANSGDTVSFGQNLAQFVARMSVNTQSCIGIISLFPLLSPTYTNQVQRANQIVGTVNQATGAYITQPTVYTFTYATGYSPGAGPVLSPMLQNGGTVDIGYLLSICIGEIIVGGSSIIGNYVSDLAPSYAGMITTLQPQSATTNKVMANPLALASVFGPSVLNAAAGLRFTLATLGAIDGKVRIVADNTYGKVGSDYKFLSTLRVTYAAIENVRNATSGFIGEPNNPTNINSMSTAIDGALKNMKTAGALIDYSYNLEASSADQIAGNMNVILALVPALQIRKIYVSVSLKPASAINQSSNS